MKLEKRPERVVFLSGTPLNIWYDAGGTAVGRPELTGNLRLASEQEYAFCLKVKTKVLKKVEKLYQKQKKTGIIRRANCNFSELERAMLDWN